MDTSGWITVVVLLVLAVTFLVFGIRNADPASLLLGIGGLILVVAIALVWSAGTEDTKAAVAAKNNRDKAKLYFDTHYPDLEVLQFDTYRLLIRYERQNPRRVCKASLIPDGKIFLLGDDQVCSVPSQGG